MTERVSVGDLEFAIAWLDTHVSEDGLAAANDASARRVAAWLRAEVARRAEAAQVREFARRTGASPARVREVLRKHTSA